jgi:hypothetical protein
MVVIEAFSAVELPYAALVPYSTCESLASLVVQLTVAPEDVMEDALTPDIHRGRRVSTTPPPEPWGTLTMNTSLLVVLPQLLVKTANLPSRLMLARGVSQ